MTEFNSLAEMTTAIPDEDAATAHFTSIRWANSAFCPHCGSVKIYHFSDNRVHKCGDCCQRFSIKVGTIFEASKVPLRKWLMAIWLLTSHKMGVASTQLARNIAVTQKTAWYMLHRLRAAAETKSFNEPLDGMVEADETFIDGKEKNKHADKRTTGSHGGANKVAIMGIMERGGELRARKMERLTTETMQAEVRANVRKGANLMTDEAKSYRGLKSDYHTVEHGAGQYVKYYFIHMNGMENAWSLFKRRVFGIRYFITVKHLDRYLSEFTFRFNRRAMGEGDRVNALIANATRRLTYKALIA